MKGFFVLSLCIFLLGCTSASKAARFQKQTAACEHALKGKNREAQALQAQLKEKDAKIEELKKKLEMVGVFE